MCNFLSFKFVLSHALIKVVDTFWAHLRKNIDARNKSIKSCTYPYNTHTVTAYSHSFPLTYFLTPWSRVLLEKLTSLCS
jgi:hypothetical protein